MGGAAGDRMRLWSRRLRGAAGYVALFTVVFFVFVWISLPTRAIAWKIGQAARDAGYIVEIEDLSISPFGGITLYNVSWTFQPSRSDQIPRKLELPEVEVDVSVLGLLFGNYDIEVDTNIEDATVHAAYTRSETESTVKINVADLPLYDVPKLQQSVNAPVQGLFALDVDLTMPENLFAKAQGEISIACAGCKVGDGETLLFVPGAGGMLAKGVTMPEIDLGSLVGKLVVADGKATAEKFETTSADLTLKVTGGMNLADPFGKSEFALDIKLLITPVLQDRSEVLKLMVQTAGPTTKLDPPEQDWLGFKLRGTASKPKFMGIKTKSKEERDRERRQAALERDAKRKAAKAKKDRADKKTPTPTGEDPTGEGQAQPMPTELSGAEGGPVPVEPREDSAQDPLTPSQVRYQTAPRPVAACTGSPTKATIGGAVPMPDTRDDNTREDMRPEDSRPVEAPEDRPSASAGQPGGEGGQDGGQDGGGQQGGQQGNQQGGGQGSGQQDGGAQGGQQDGGAQGGQDGGAQGGQDGGQQDSGAQQGEGGQPPAAEGQQDGGQAPGGPVG